MKCPFCGFEETQVKDSRTSEDGTLIRRRRLCPECGSRFSTAERIILKDMLVVKKDGTEEPFDREKMKRSLKIALHKRPFEEERLERIVSGIQRQLELSGETSFPSFKLGDLVMDSLLELDIIAYIRYASVYKNFEQMNDFQGFLSQLIKWKEKKEFSQEVEPELDLTEEKKERIQK